MIQYKAPLRDIRFVLFELLDFATHYQSLGLEEAPDEEMIESILEELADFAERVLHPLNATGDREGCRLENGEVTTPKGFKQAYRDYVELGWTALAGDPAYGGQGLPSSLGGVQSEIVGAANWSWSMYPGLTHGAVHTIEAHGTEEQKRTYLSELVTGRWSGTMCPTEPQAGSDLGQVACRAVPQDDGSHAITGSKIFISAGEHDLTENIVHIVLARLPDAPAGTKGISLFIVPKYLPGEDGALGPRNNVVCSSLEDKMGIKGSATAVLNFEEATGYLIGPPHKGLNCMFTFINFSRVGNAIQGVAAAELSFQGALPYARERLAMRSLSGVKAPDKPADPIIVHPDVRRMLLTQKVIAEGGRAMVYDAARIADLGIMGNDSERDWAEGRLGLLTPILKGFLTELGFEAATVGVQVYGGHGYIKEMGMEQILRDIRIATIYEGTTGIQALDLLGRKIMLNRGRELKLMLTEIRGFCRRHGLLGGGEMRQFTRPLARLLRRWEWSTKVLMLKASKDRDVVGSASVDYLMFAGYVLMGWYWARMAEVALQKIAASSEDEAFYRAKVTTARFYFQRILPRANMHHAAMRAAPGSVMALDEVHFSF